MRQVYKKGKTTTIMNLPVEPASEPGDTYVFTRSLPGLTKDEAPADDAEELDDDEDEGVRGACSWA